MPPARVVIAAFALALAGCASVRTGGTEELTVRSVPDVAEISITLDGVPVHRGSTPANVRLARGNTLLNRKTYEVLVTKPGFETRRFQLTWADGWNFGDLVIGPRFGMVCIDPETGMTWKVDTSTLAAALDEELELDDTPRLTIITADRVPLQMWKYAERIQ